MRKILLASVLVLMAGGAQAATLNVIGGILHGASGVDVGGVLYDVEFVDGTCFDLFDGCDELSDFAFNDLASAAAASQALLDQVFLDGPSGAFDTDPRLTIGCGNSPYVGAEGNQVVCRVDTLFDVQAFELGPEEQAEFFVIDIFATSAQNWNSTNPANIIDNQDGVGNFSFGPGNLFHYARWTPIPEPSTALLVGLGLVGIAARWRV